MVQDKTTVVNVLQGREDNCSGRNTDRNLQLVNVAGLHMAAKLQDYNIKTEKKKKEKKFGSFTNSSSEHSEISDSEV